jgi:hypothetical protein
MKATEAYTHLQAMTASELHARRRAIIADAAGDYKSVSLDGLRELAVIFSLLRVKGTKPEKGSAAAKQSALDLI